MPLSPIWAFAAFLLWQLLARLPLGLAPRAFWPEALAIGFVLSAYVVYKLDQRFFPSDTESPAVPKRPLWMIYALIAGVGFAIIGSELGNVGEALSNEPIPLAGPKPESTNPISNALLASFVYPVCFIFVLVGVSQRALLNSVKPWTSICMIALIGTIGGPFSRIAQLAFVSGLPAWLYVRSGSVLLAIIAYLPTTSLPIMEYFGVQPGILGFDVIETTGRIAQPIWFNLLGAALMAAGVGPLLYAFEPDDREET